MTTEPDLNPTDPDDADDASPGSDDGDTLHDGDMSADYPDDTAGGALRDSAADDGED
jgi:hypothetical protein